MNQNNSSSAHKREKLPDNEGRDFLCSTTPPDGEIVRPVRDLNETCPGRNQRQRLVHLLNRTERISRTMRKQGWCSEFWKVRRAQLVPFPRRMQRVGQCEQSRNESGILGCGHGRLSAAVRVASKKDFSGNDRSDEPNGIDQSRTISRRHGRKRRSVWPQLPERKVAAQNRYACIGKSCGDLD